MKGGNKNKSTKTKVVSSTAMTIGLLSFYFDSELLVFEEFKTDLF